MENLILNPKPITKEFTVKELRTSISVPEFQRWIVKSNKRELTESINAVGILRCPVICYVRSEKKNFIIDGNHLRTIIVESPSYKDEERITCIFNEVDDMADAAEQFRMLNTKGKNLDWVDVTNLYRNVYGINSVYESIWSTYLGNPSKPEDVVCFKGFTLSTIIEFLVGSDKRKYREGFWKVTQYPDQFIYKKNLLSFLINNSYSEWNKQKLELKPSGSAILGFAKVWFGNKLYNKYPEAAFLQWITVIFQQHQQGLKKGSVVINRDNAGKLLKDYLSVNFKLDLK